MNDERKARLLADLVLLAELLAEVLDQFSADNGLLVISKGGHPIYGFGPNGETEGFGAAHVRDFRRLLDDARREGLVP